MLLIQYHTTLCSPHTQPFPAFCQQIQRAVGGSRVYDWWVKGKGDPDCSPIVYYSTVNVN